MSIVRRLRILAFHGYHGSGAVLRRQLAPLAERLEDVAEFETPDAPSIAAGDFGWWHGTFPSSRRRFAGWSITSEWLKALSLEQFDGVFGFSQGAALAGLLTGMRDDVGFAIMASGFVSPEPEHQPLYQAVARSHIPSLHLIGTSDSIVEPAESRRLVDLYTDPLVATHPGGHVIPSDPKSADAVREFLVQFQSKQ
jgi:predicted esterase